MEVFETLESYFYDQVEPSGLSGDIKAYLVMCLSKWATKEPTEEALGLDYLQALQHHHWNLRSVGDKALYWAGVIPHHLKKKSVSKKYVEHIGSAAFATLAESVQSSLFWDLSETFKEATEVLYEASANPYEDIEKVVQRAWEHGDERDKKALSRKGIYLLKPTS